MFGWKHIAAGSWCVSVVLLAILISQMTSETDSVGQGRNAMLHVEDASYFAEAHRIVQAQYPEMLTSDWVMEMTSSERPEIVVYMPGAVSAVLTIEFDREGKVISVSAVK